MAKLEPYPFPKRNPQYEDKDIFCIGRKDREYRQYCYERITQPDSISIANQFFSIENLLLESFQYVLPIKENAATCSVRFATIIRESANLFEIVSRRIYHMFFVFDPKLQIDIFNFLSLDAFLNLSKEELLSPFLDSFLGNDHKIEPFSSLKTWDGRGRLNSEHIPKWWTAYNKLKHDTESIKEWANLINAIFAMGGLFLLIKKVYGEGLISGFLRKPSDTNIKETIMYQIKISEIFFTDQFKTMAR
jgi:hypothetical protein